jgi:hypothetical protein
LTEVKDAASKVLKAAGSWRNLHATALVSAFTSFFSLMIAGLGNDLSQEAQIFFLSAAATARIGAAIAFALFIIIGLTLLDDIGYTTRINDKDFRITVTLKALTVVAKLVVTFSPPEGALTKASSPCGCSGKPYWWGDSKCFTRECWTCTSTSDLVYQSQWRVILCLRKTIENSWQHNLLIFATTLSLLVTMALTLKTLHGKEVVEQLEKKVLRPTLLRTGYVFTWIGSKAGLFFILLGAGTGPTELLPMWHDMQTPALDGFTYVLVIALGLALSALLTNEVARVCENPEKNYAAASSADGLRSVCDLVQVLTLPGCAFALLAFSQPMGHCLFCASICAVLAFAGCSLLIVGAGFAAPVSQSRE